MRNFSQDHRWLSINTATIRKSRGVDLPLPEIIEACVRRDIRAIAPWRDQVQAAGLDNIAQLVKAYDLELSGYCRGGMFPANTPEGLRAAHDDNRRAVDEARALGAKCLVLVVGGGGKDLPLARMQVRDGIAKLLEYSRSVGMPLALEPLHPMFAADRACVNTMEQALDICDELDPSKSGALGVACDVYHVWWDPKLESQIARAGRKRLLAFHVCDWLVPTTDMLLDRGMMGDGVIDIRRIRGWVEAQGFDGYSEVEIFSQNNWW
jgi:sugar phosphate isomerase/epimerase